MTTTSPTEHLRFAIEEKSYPDTRSERDGVAAEIKDLGQRMHPHNSFLGNRQQEGRAKAAQRVKFSAELIADMEDLARALENGEPLTDELADAYVTLSRAAETAEQSIGVDARNLDRLAEQMERPLDAYDALHKKFPILSARRPFGA